MSEAQNSEQRRLQRHRLNVPVEVFDSNRNLRLGRLVDIHRQGLMLLGDQPLQVDSLYQLELRLPEPLQGDAVLLLGVDCLWTRGEEGASSHWSGLQIIDLSEHAERQIDDLVALMATP